MTVTINNRILQIDSTLPAGYAGYELRIYSSRNDVIVKESDFSPYDPNPETRLYGTTYEGMYNLNYLFPVIDFKHHSDMEAVVTFEDVIHGSWAMNPMYYKGRFPLSEKVVIPSNVLEWWENFFHYDNPQPLAKEFYLRKSYADAGDLSLSVELLTDIWEGRFVIYGLSDSGEETLLEEQAFETKPTVAVHTKPAQPRDLSRESLIQALDDTIGFILRSQNYNPDSYLTGGTHLFYDYDARTFRQKNWLWTYGPSIKTLLDAREIPEIAEKYDVEVLLQSAIDQGELCLRHLKEDETKPHNGLMLCRYEFSLINTVAGYELKYGPADGLFQVGFGMIPLYRATGDARYLQFGETMVKATGKLLDLDVIVQQDFYEVTDSWKNYSRNESGFGMEGIAEVYKETQNPEYLEIGKKFIDQLIQWLEMEDGSWARNYWRHSRVVEPTDYATKSMGWAMMGLTSAVTLGFGQEYLNKSIVMAQQLIDHQLPDGSWSYNYSEDISVNGVSEKGTAVWSLLMYRLYHMTNDTACLNCARKALTWLINNQYLGEDIDGYGGIPVRGPRAGVIYRDYFKLACQYTSGLFGLALMEELALSGNS